MGELTIEEAKKVDALLPCGIFCEIGVKK